MAERVGSIRVFLLDDHEVVRRGVRELLEAEDEIRPEHLPSEIFKQKAPAPGADPFPAGVVRPLAEIERMSIEHALEVCAQNKTRAAQLLGISRQTLRTKLKEFRPEADTEEADDSGDDA